MLKICAGFPSFRHVSTMRAHFFLWWSELFLAEDFESVWLGRFPRKINLWGQAGVLVGVNSNGGPVLWRKERWVVVEW